MKLCDTRGEQEFRLHSVLFWGSEMDGAGSRLSPLEAPAGDGHGAAAEPLRGHLSPRVIFQFFREG